MDQNRIGPADRLMDQLAGVARAERAPGVDVAPGVLAAIRGLRPVPAWDWSFPAVALASCAVALVTAAVSAGALSSLLDPLVSMLSVYPDIQF